MSREPKSRPLAAGMRLDGRYELLYAYAQGGMATVWLARVQGKHGFEKLYAVKTILPQMAADQGFRNMFLDEARIAARIRHGNVAEIEDLGEDQGHLYMVLEWIQGDPWSKLYSAIVERGDPLPSDIMLRIAANACGGLHAAHELSDDVGQPLNVVHRDVSPQNIMVTEAGTVKVIDFGVAKAAVRASEQTRAGLIKGKLEYLSPEVALGRPADRRADVWAVGAVLYQIFSGQPPFTGKGDIEVMRRITSGKPPQPLPDTVPPPVAAAIMAALQPDPARRVGTAQELQRMLEGAITTRVTPEDVARCLRQYLKPRITARHAAIADALREAAARAGAPVPRSPSAPDFPRGPSTFPALPPEASAVSSKTGVYVPKVGSSVVADLQRANDPPPPDAPTGGSGFRPIHGVWVGAATLVTLTVWSMVIALAMPSSDDPNAGAPSSSQVR
jgi:eukaryotic-like serine/threonine-protein kinase